MKNFKEFYFNEEKEQLNDIDKIFSELMSAAEDDEITEEELAEKFKDINPEYIDRLEELCIDECEEYGPLTERLIKKIVIRGMKKMKKWKSDKKNHRVVLDPKTGRPKEVRMPPAEIRRRKKSQRLGAIKRKAGKAISLIKRRMSLRKKKILQGKGK